MNTQKVTGPCQLIFAQAWRGCCEQAPENLVAVARGSGHKWGMTADDCSDNIKCAIRNTYLMLARNPLSCQTSNSLRTISASSCSSASGTTSYVSRLPYCNLGS
mmetsp:Transcript_10522/g.16660  ORF Transcript_10522/g.16660 Transcript_10522/m.16660 type:complete len:104 (-) Transcript_10522:306-617(-)